MSRHRAITILILAAAFTIAGPAAGDWIDRGTGMLRSAFQSLLLPELDRSVSHDTPWPGEEEPSAKLEIDSGGPLAAGAYLVRMKAAGFDCGSRTILLQH